MKILQIGFGVFGKQRCKALSSLLSKSDYEVHIIDPAFKSINNEEIAKMGLPESHFRFIDGPLGFYELAIISLPHSVALSALRDIGDTASRYLVEKPAVLSSSEFEMWRILDSELDLYIGYNYRFMPHVQELARIIKTRDLGQMRRFEIFLGHGGAPSDGSSWKMKLEEVGGGALIDPGSHCIDLANVMIPNLSNFDFHGAYSRGFWPIQAPEDHRIIASNGELLVSIHASLIEWRSTFYINVLFESGYVRLSGRDRSYGLPSLEIGQRWAWKDSGLGQKDTEITKIFDKNESLEKELAHILEIDSTSIIPPASVEDAIKVTELFEAASKNLAF